jgi:uncharacterized membrane protein
MSADPELLSQLNALSARVSQLEAELERLRQQPPGSSYAPLRLERVEPASPARLPRRQRASLESRIGSQLFNRVGIVALLIGAAWFLKFAIDERWIGPAARVLIGLGAGGGLIGWSEWFRAREYKAFSYSLKAVGTGVLYLSMWAAYTLFGLIPSSVAFLAMVLVTAGNAWLCWRQNSEVLAFYAAVGGFLTPLLLWTAESDELSLFSYLLVLDLAVLALVALRPWSRVLLAAFAGTALYAVGWYLQHYTAEKFGMTAFFVVVFFLLFSAAPQLLRNLRLATPGASLTGEDELALLLLPLLNGLLAFAELYALLGEPVSTSLRPWVAFGFAAFYLGMLRMARSPRLAGTPTRLPATYLLLSVLAFTGAIPLAWSGRPIAVCWSVESVLLFGLARRGALRSESLLRTDSVLRALAGAVLALAFTATVAQNSAIVGEFYVVFNARFMTYLVGVAAGVGAAWIAKQALAIAAEDAKRGWRWEGIFASTGSTMLLMIGVCFEIGAYWNGQRMTHADRLIAEQFSYSAWSMLLGVVLLAAGFLRQATTLRWLGLALLTLSIAKVFLYDLRELSQGYRILSFLGLGILLLLVSFVYQRNLLGLR